MNEQKPGSKASKYILSFTNGDKVEIVLYSANDTEKAAYLENFLEKYNTAGRYFICKSTKKMYNKDHIVSCEEK